MHHADHRPCAVVEREQNAPMKLPDDEGARAVNRIDDPGQSVGTGREAMLLAEDSVAGIDALNLVTDRLLRCTIGERHRIVANASTLILDREAHAKVRQDRAPREVRQMAGKGGVLSDRAIVHHRHRLVSPEGGGYGTSVLASSHASISSFTIEGSSEAAPPPYTAPLRAGVAGGLFAYSTPAAMSLTKRVATPGSVCGKVTHR